MFSDERFLGRPPGALALLIALTVSLLNVVYVYWLCACVVIPCAQLSVVLNRCMSSLIVHILNKADDQPTQATSSSVSATRCVQQVYEEESWSAIGIKPLEGSLAVNHKFSSKNLNDPIAPFVLIAETTLKLRQPTSGHSHISHQKLMVYDQR